MTLPEGDESLLAWANPANKPLDPDSFASPGYGPLHSIQS